MLIASLLALADISATVVPPATKPAASIVSGEASAFWKQDGNRVVHLPSGMSIPLDIPGQHFKVIGISSHHGTGLDDVLEWQDADRENYTSLFVFRPALADTGLAAAMSDTTIHSTYGDAAHPYDDKVVGAGGVDGTVRRILYDGAVLNGHAKWTGSAFLKVGAWLVVARMSGPPERKAELEAALTGLLDGLRFSAAMPVHAYHAIAFSDCPLPDNGLAQPMAASMTDTLGFLLMVTTDAGVEEQDEGKGEKMPHPSDITRVPDALCRAKLDVGGDHFVEFWPEKGPTGLVTRVSRLVVLNDAGGVLEVSQNMQGKPPFFVVHHDIGKAEIIGTLDSPPSQDQLAAMITGNSSLLHPAASGYSVDAKGNTNIYLPPDPAKRSK